MIETNYTHYTKKKWHKQTISILSCDPCHLSGVPRRQISTFFLCTEILRTMASSFDVPSGLGLKCLGTTAASATVIPVDVSQSIHRVCQWALCTERGGSRELHRCQNKQLLGR